MWFGERLADRLLTRQGVEMNAVSEMRGVAKKKAKVGEPQKRYGTLMRVSDEFAAAMRDVTGFEKISAADFADAHLLPILRKRYRNAVLREAKRMEGGGK
jgi:hypothetical protein